MYRAEFSDISRLQIFVLRETFEVSHSRKLIHYECKIIIFLQIFVHAKISPNKVCKPVGFLIQGCSEVIYRNFHKLFNKASSYQLSHCFRHRRPPTHRKQDSNMRKTRA